MILNFDTSIALIIAGLIFLLALVLGIWKYYEMRTTEEHKAHIYVDIAHRSALMYSFAALLIAIVVQYDGYNMWLNIACTLIQNFFYVSAIFSYIAHGFIKDTKNQMADLNIAGRLFMIALVIGEIVPFAIILSGIFFNQSLPWINHHF